MYPDQIKSNQICIARRLKFKQNKYHIGKYYNPREGKLIWGGPGFHNFPYSLVTESGGTGRKDE